LSTPFLYLTMTHSLCLFIQQVGMATGAGNPVINARANGNFAFIELRSIEEANAMLNLNGIPFMGNLLKVRTPCTTINIMNQTD
jgi:hypothetical protein